MGNSNSIAYPVIIALDYETQDRALALVVTLGSDADFYKVVLQMLTEAGPDVVRALVAMGKRVFLDLKLHEIPNSVAGATLVTVHASGGSAVLQAAARLAA